MNLKSIDRNKWDRHINGWVIVDCTIYAKDAVLLVARKDLDPEIAALGWDSDVPTRMIYAFFDGRCGNDGFEGFAFPVCGVSYKPAQQGLILNQNSEGQIFARGSGSNGLEAVKPGADNEISFFGNRLVCIDGWTYALGIMREVHKRVDIEKWQPMMNGFDQPRYEGCPSD